MLKRFLGHPKNKQKSEVTPFINYAIFDDPNRYFESLPSGNENSWFLASPNVQHLKLLLGMAFLNEKKVAIIVPDKESEAIVQKFALHLIEDINEIANNHTIHDQINSNLLDIINKYRAEYSDLTKTIEHLSSKKFGSLNGLEVATTLTKLFPRTQYHPYPWIDTKHFEWTYEEYRNLYDTIVERNNKFNTIVHHKLQRLFRINPITWADSPVDLIRKTLGHHLLELGQLINQLDLILHTSKPLWYSTLKSKESLWLSNDTPLGRIKRMTLHGMQEAGMPVEPLLEWKKAINAWQSNFEKSELINTSNGFQAISLGDLESEIKSLYHELNLIGEWLDAIKESTDIYVTNEKLPLGIKLLMEAGSSVPPEHKSDVFTYWYLYHWLEHHVSDTNWKALQTSPERIKLTTDLNSAICNYLSNINGNISENKPNNIFDFNIYSHSKSEGIPAEYLKIYWKTDTGQTESEERFKFIVRSAPSIPMEYSLLVQMYLEAETSLLQALPYNIPKGSTLWEGRPNNPLIQENPAFLKINEINIL